MIDNQTLMNYATFFIANARKGGDDGKYQLFRTTRTLPAAMNDVMTDHLFDLGTIAIYGLYSNRKKYPYCLSGYLEQTGKLPKFNKELNNWGFEYDQQLLYLDEDVLLNNIILISRVRLVYYS